MILLLEALGLLSGFVLSLFLWRKSGGSPETAVHLLCLGALVLFLGGKGCYLLERGGPFRAEELLRPGYSGIGALVLVLAFWLVWSRLAPFPVLRFFDAVAPGAALGLGFGRLACFLRGCCGGIPADLPWAIRFPPGTPVYSAQVNSGEILAGAVCSLSVHPTQLYESFFSFAVFPFLVWSTIRLRKDGLTFFAGMLAYGLFRFAVEPLRFDYRPWVFLSIGQAISLALILAAIPGLIFSLRGGGLSPQSAPRIVWPPSPGDTPAPARPRVRIENGRPLMD